MLFYKPGLTSQRHSGLISSDSEQFQVCFSAFHYLKISEQRWFSSETALIFAGFRMIFLVIFSIFSNFSKVPQFLCHFAEIWGKITFFNTRNAILMTTSRVFITEYVITIWYSLLHVIISELIQSKSALNHRLCSALKTQCFRAKKFSADSDLILSETALNFSVPNSADSDKIRAHQLWNKANQRWYSSSSLNQRWKTSKSNLWNSAAQRWSSLGLQPGKVVKTKLKFRKSKTLEMVKDIEYDVERSKQICEQERKPAQANCWKPVYKPVYSFRRSIEAK